MSAELWTGDFGVDYQRRNMQTSPGVPARQCVWEKLMPADCKSVLEVGAGCGENLEAIAQFSDAKRYAVEPQEFAREQMYHKSVVDSRDTRSSLADSIDFPDNVADLVFTSGVLIHIPTDKLLSSMREIHRVAKRWIICGEYFAPSQEMIPYRGHNDALWRRDYGSLWLDNFPDLTCTQTLFAWKRTTGLDNITFWVFEKDAKSH